MFLSLLEVGLYCDILPHTNAFAAYHRIWAIIFLLSFVSNHFLKFPLLFLQCPLSYLAVYCLASMCLCFLQFFFFFLWLKSNLIALYSEMMLDIISIFWNWSRLDLWLKIWSNPENVSCVLKKNVYSASLGWQFMYISIRTVWSNMSLKNFVSLLIFCLDDMSIGEIGVLKSHTIIILLSISPFYGS